MMRRETGPEAVAPRSICSTSVDSSNVLDGAATITATETNVTATGTTEASTVAIGTIIAPTTTRMLGPREKSAADGGILTSAVSNAAAEVERAADLTTPAVPNLPAGVVTINNSDAGPLLETNGTIDLIELSKLKNNEK